MHPYDKFKSENPVPERPKLDATDTLSKNDPNHSELLRNLSRIPIGPIRGSATVMNLAQFNSVQTFPNCTVLTLDGIDGFAWYDQNGTRHDEGFTWPRMNIIRDATVEVLYGENGERSAGWKKGNE